MNEMRLDKWLLSVLYVTIYCYVKRVATFPVMELTQTGQLSLFLIFMALAFFYTLVGNGQMVDFYS